MLNWRDARHPRAGGAEFYTHELARRLVQQGAEVEWFAASFPGGAAEEEIDGIRFVREGRQWTVHLRAIQRYRNNVRNRFDVVIDQTNTVPFFAPVWADVPVLMMIWQLAREVWWYESKFPLNAIGYAMEPVYLRLYRNTPALTFSASTAADLRALGFRRGITVAPVGIALPNSFDSIKNEEPTFVYVGRIAPSKRVHEIVEAFATFRKANGSGRLLLVGSGPATYVNRLTNRASRLGVGPYVELVGWLQGADKHRVMAQAHALVMASAREGWGLVVTECNACGTPAIVYNVPGLRDSVRHLETGLVVDPSPRGLAAGMLQLIGDRPLYARLQTEGLRWSNTLTYEAGAAAVIERLQCLIRPGHNAA